jgi:hypothetical protein
MIEFSPPHSPEVVRALKSCRRVALTVVALVAPVVEAAGNLVDAPGNGGGLKGFLRRDVHAMRAGLRRLGGGS